MPNRSNNPPAGPRPTRLVISVPADFELRRAVCSYGYFLLAPNLWLPATESLRRRFHPEEFGLPGNTFEATIDQPRGRGAKLRVRCDLPLEPAVGRAVRRALIRMLRIDTEVKRWYRICPAAKRRGFGRMFRSPTLLEDLVKTITSCNVSWPNTVRMNQLLVERIGGGAFPSAARLARCTPSRLKKSCKVGYRAQRIVRLARRFDRGELSTKWFESPERQTDELHEALLELEGFGPYAAANGLQLLGHDDHLPIDTETYRHFCKVTGLDRPANPKHLDRLIEARYEPFRPHRFRAYWFELWRDYERRFGDAWTWEAGRVGSAFTASRLTRDED